MSLQAPVLAPGLPSLLALPFERCLNPRVEQHYFLIVAEYRGDVFLHFAAYKERYLADSHELTRQGFWDCPVQAIGQSDFARNRRPEGAAERC
jgi:hypothetical protein